MKIAAPLLAILVTTAGCGSGAPFLPDAAPPSLAGVPWGAPIVLDASSTISSGARCVTVTDDGLEMYYLWMGIDAHVERKTRASTQDAWSRPALVTALEPPNAYYPECPNLTRDALTLRVPIQATPNAGEQYGIALLHRTDRNADWQRDEGLWAYDLQAFSASVSGPVEIPSQLALAYDGLDGHIYTSTRATVDDPWADRTPVTSLDGAGFQELPAMSPDQREIYTTTYGTDLCANGLSCRTINVATRDDATQPFGPPHPVAEIASGLQTSAPALSSDAHTLYFLGRNTDGALALYTATR